MTGGNWALSLIQLLKSVPISQGAWLMKSGDSIKLDASMQTMQSCILLCRVKKQGQALKLLECTKSRSIFKSRVILKVQDFLIPHEGMQFLFVVNEFHFYFLLFPLSSGSDFSNHVWYAHLYFQAWTLVSDQWVTACLKQYYTPK